MKRSFLIQFIIYLLAVTWTNLRHPLEEPVKDFDFGTAGGIQVDLKPGQSFFTSSVDTMPPRTGGTLVMAISAEPENLNYYTSTSAVAKQILDYVFEPLLDYDYRDWTLSRPVLAERFSISPDHKTYTFYLRKNIYWHDGQKLTAADVLFSLKAILNPFVDDAPLRAYYQKVIEAHTSGDSVFQVSTSDTYFLNLEFLGGFAVLPEHLYDPQHILRRYSVADLMNPAIMKEATDLRQWADDFNTSSMNRPAGKNAAPLIGSGPYRFYRWSTGDYIALIRNRNYWHSGEYIPGFAPQAGYLDTIIFKIIQDPTAKLTALKAGDVAFVPRLRAIQYFEQTNSPDFLERFQKVTYVVPAYSYIGWNNSRPYFRDKRVRQAMTMLIDRDSFNKYVNYNLGIPTIGPFYIYGKQYNHNIKRWPYDPERAVELLDEAGWVDHDGDGIRDKDGIPFRFTFSISEGSRASKYMALMMKEDLRKIGIEVSIRSLEWSVYVENLRDRRFDVVMLLWIGGLESDPYQIWHSDNIENRGSNFVGFRNAEADSLIMVARYEMDPVKRNAMYYRFQEILHEEQPYTFLYYQRDAAAYSKRFYGVKWLPIRPGYKLFSWWDGAAPLP